MRSTNVESSIHCRSGNRSDRNKKVLGQENPGPRYIRMLQGTAIYGTWQVCPGDTRRLKRFLATGSGGGQCPTHTTDQASRVLNYRGQ